ncbi:MAG: penicillin-binding protein [Bacteroidota bacterium]
MEEKKGILWRIYIVYLLICLFAAFIIGRIVKIGVFESDHWESVADQFTYEYKDIEAVRGNIFDVNGSLLATSLPYYQIAIDPNADGLTDKVFSEGVDSLAYALSALFGDRSKSEYKRELERARRDTLRYLVLQKEISHEELQAVKKFPLLRKGRFKGGFIVTQKSKRELPFRFLAARTIGYVNENSKTSLGLEGAYNHDLKGIGGKRLMRKITGGVEMPVNDENEVEPQDGLDLISTIDIHIQDVAENALMEKLIEHKADHGCVILMEVATGEIRAIANLTRKDSNTYLESYNWAIGAATEPGSTFKLVSLMAAIEDGYLNLDEVVDVEGGVTSYYGIKMPDSHKPKKNKMNVKEVFEESSNVGVSKLITKYYSKDPQKFIDRICKMGINMPLGISIPGETKPRIKSTKDKDWSGVSLPFISIGYESLLTPLQMLTFYNTVANNGIPMKPVFVREMRRRGQTVKKFAPEQLSTTPICSRQTIQKAQELLRAVVQNGTAKSLGSAIFQIAGKTGTAQIAKGGTYGSDGNHTYQASFVGYFPADKPKYTCMVMVSAPSSGEYYGALVAGPIFKEVAYKVYSTTLDIHEELNATMHQLIATAPRTKAGFRHDIKTIYSELAIKCNSVFTEHKWLKPVIRDSILSFTENKVQDLLKSKVVPDLRGMNLKDALYLLENAGLNVTVLGSGAVKEQSLDPGTRFNKGAHIMLVLS